MFPFIPPKGCEELKKEYKIALENEIRCENNRKRANDEHEAARKQVTIAKKNLYNQCCDFTDGGHNWVKNVDTEGKYINELFPKKCSACEEKGAQAWLKNDKTVYYQSKQDNEDYKNASWYSPNER